MNYNHQDPRYFLTQAVKSLLDENCYRGIVIPADLPEDKLAIRGGVGTDRNGNKVLLLYLSDKHFHPFKDYFRAIACTNNLPNWLSEHGYVKIGGNLYKPRFSFSRQHFDLFISSERFSSYHAQS